MTAVTKHMSDASFQLYCARRYLGNEEEEHMMKTHGQIMLELQKQSNSFMWNQSLCLN